MPVRYSASTIDALEMMDDDKVDLDLIAALIRHIVLEEEVCFCLLSSRFSDVTELSSVAVGNVRANSYFGLPYRYKEEEYFVFSLLRIN